MANSVRERSSHLMGMLTQRDTGLPSGFLSVPTPGSGQYTGQMNGAAPHLCIPLNDVILHGKISIF